MVWLLAMTCVAWFLQMAIQWVVNPVDKMKFDQMFKIADTDMDGFVSGDEIRSIFLQSGLPNTTLAHIWWVTTQNNWKLAPPPMLILARSNPLFITSVSMELINMAFEK